MESTEAVMIEGENYEVVDECTEEDDSVNSVVTKQAESSLKCTEMASEGSVTTKATETNKGTVEKEDVSMDSSTTTPLTDQAVTNEPETKETEINETATQETETNETVQNETANKDDQNIVAQSQEESSRTSREKSVDFTADISLDQLDEQRDMTDEDVMSHLDEIENIVLDINTFPLNKENDPKGNSVQEQSAKQDAIELPTSSEPPLDAKIKIEKDAEPDILLLENVVVKTENVDATECKSTSDSEYKKKLKEKEAIVKERLIKLARVLGFSYPCYEPWLELMEKIHGTPVCKLKPSRPCRLDKPYTNRWKFICSRKIVQDPTRKTGNGDTTQNKNTDIVWHMEPTEMWGVKAKNESDFPPFVLRAIKVFKEFLQATEELPSEKSEGGKDNFSEDISMDIDNTENEKANDAEQEWMSLVVRCNSMDELMLFATGRNISRNTMDRLKQVYETGSGKDCNVKSLYCKSLNKCKDDTTVTNTTFLVGSEALDEVVGNLKVQLAPKTNFWSNTAGAENVAKTVAELLAPTPTVTLLDIGCGIGLIGLMLASKCQQVIGVDSPSEVEEAEMTCELNNIKNASFIMGTQGEVAQKIFTVTKNRKTIAVINANTNIGKSIEVMMSLRKIPSLKRIAMITALTKQSVRAILELARPMEKGNIKPFRPINACVVDTLPNGPHFEIVILMERRPISKPIQSGPNVVKIGEAKGKNKDAIAGQSKDKPGNPNPSGMEKGMFGKQSEFPVTRKSFDKSPAESSNKKMKGGGGKRPIPPPRGPNEILTRSKVKAFQKRTHSPDKNDTVPKKFMKTFSNKPWQADFPGKKKKDWTGTSPDLRINPLHDKKLREHKEQADLRDRLSSNRVDADIAQRVKEHQAVLEIAKEKLSGPAPTVDITTAKQLQSMLNMVLEQTNKLQSQLPRSIWDRIAPPDNSARCDQMKTEENQPFSKSRYTQEIGDQEVIITPPHPNFVNEASNKKPPFRKNILPLEPDMMPVGPAIPNRKQESYRRASPPRFQSDFRKQTPAGPWNSDQFFNRDRWNDDEEPMRSGISPPRAQLSPVRYDVLPSRRFSPKRPLLSPPRRPYSPPRRHFSPECNDPSLQFHQRESPIRRQISPVQRSRGMSPPVRRQMSPFRIRLTPPLHRDNSPPRRMPSPTVRPVSPNYRRQPSPSGRPISPFRPGNISPPRNDGPIRVQFVPSRRQGPSPTRVLPLSKPSREVILPRRSTIPQGRQMSPTRRPLSPQRSLMSSTRIFSPPRRQPSPPLNRFADEWDIPSRGAVEQTWLQPLERMPNNTGWRSDTTPASGSASGRNWEQPSSNNERFNKNLNPEKWVGRKPSREPMWIAVSNNWNSDTRPMPVKDNWQQQSQQDNRWPGTSKGNNDDWNVRSGSDFTSHDDPWSDNNKVTGKGRWDPPNNKDTWRQQADKDDWNDLPEDARDPWGDDADIGVKERWVKGDIPTGSFPKKTWQNKVQNFPPKSQWQNNGNQNTQSRWFSQTDIGKKVPSSSWQSGSNSDPWQQPQSMNFQSQRSYNNNQFK